MTSVELLVTQMVLSFIIAGVAIVGINYLCLQLDNWYRNTKGH